MHFGFSWQTHLNLFKIICRFAYFSQYLSNFDLFHSLCKLGYKHISLNFWEPELMQFKVYKLVNCSKIKFKKGLINIKIW